MTEQIVHPKTIRGTQTEYGRVHPNVVNAYSELQQCMRAFRFESILSAADLRSGEFIDDLHTYFGGAQPGGAPPRLYMP